MFLATQLQQDTLKSHPPENKSMKKATFTGISVSTIFYLLCGLLGYAAFGNKAPGNFLTGFGFYEPFWLIDFANVCIVIHLVGAYQVTSNITNTFPSRFLFFEDRSVQTSFCWPRLIPQ